MNFFDVIGKSIRSALALGAWDRTKLGGWETSVFPAKDVLEKRLQYFLEERLELKDRVELFELEIEALKKENARLKESNMRLIKRGIKVHKALRYFEENDG